MQATQVRHPWQATLRTVFAAVVGLAGAWVIIVKTLGLDETVPWVAGSIAIAGAITRVLAIPAVNEWLNRFFPWLSANGTHNDGPVDRVVVETETSDDDQTDVVSPEDEVTQD